MHRSLRQPLNPCHARTRDMHHGLLSRTSLAAALVVFTMGCGSSTSTSGSSTGGKPKGTGGSASGGSSVTTSGGSQSGGSSSQGGATASAGGSTQNGNGGSSSGGSNLGGANPGGATSGSTGGTKAGGAQNGGANAGGSGGTQSGGKTGSGSGGTTGENQGGTTGSGGVSTGGSVGGSTSNTPGPVVSGNCVATPLSELVGWASQSGQGVSSTTGGGSSAPVVVTDIAQLNTLMKGATPAVVHLKGKIEGKVTLDDSANKTIIGCGGHLVGNIMMENSSNIMIQNIKISSTNPDTTGDLITVDNQSHHIWLDHLELRDGGDGNLDMVHGSDYITVSWTKFVYSQLPVGGTTVRDSDPGAHQFACLIGHDNKNAAEDTDHLKITIHHSYWADNIMERMPRIRYGQVHLLNNLYASSGGYTTNYAIRVGWSANVRSEHNLYKGINNPFDFNDSNPEAKVESIGDVFTDCTGTMDVTGKGPAFKPPYSYTADPVDSLEAKIRAGAGPR